MKPRPRQLVTDRNTGETRLQARGGRTYTIEEVEHLERRADLGDPEAIAVVESLDMTGLTTEEMLHDCPECRAALARGEKPTTWTAAETRALRRGPRPATGRPTMRRRPYRGN